MPGQDLRSCGATWLSTIKVLSLRILSYAGLYSTEVQLRLPYSADAFLFAL